MTRCELKFHYVVRSLLPPHDWEDIGRAVTHMKHAAVKVGRQEVPKSDVCAASWGHVIHSVEVHSICCTVDDMTRDSVQ